jgi:alkylhydroperoxidase family enzyme
MQLSVHTLDDAPADARPVLQGIVDDLGVLPNLAATAAASPALLAGFDGLRRAVGTTKLDPVHREAAGLAVGVAVDNRYGVAFHSMMLASLGVDEADIATMRAGRAPTAPAVAAVYTLARTIAAERGKVTADVVAAATDAGLTTEAVLEVLLEAGFATLVGFIDNLAGRVELDPFLAAHAPA